MLTERRSAMADIIMAGFGGQGVLTAGKILIDVAARAGKNVSWTSSYGAEMRGGTASCSVILSKPNAFRFSQPGIWCRASAIPIARNTVMMYSTNGFENRYAVLKKPLTNTS